MVTVPRRRSLVALCVAALLLVLGACGGDDDSADVKGEVDETTESTEDTTTTEETTTTEGSTTTEDDGTTTTAGDIVDADEEVDEPEWGQNAAVYRGSNGTRVAFHCPPNTTGGPFSVWGTGTYTDDSSVCMAAVHAGLITEEEGDRVVIEIGPGQDAYTGSEANGVTSSDYGTWGGSYTFPVS